VCSEANPEPAADGRLGAKFSKNRVAISIRRA